MDASLLRRQWRRFLSWKRKSPLERYLDKAVDFADLEYRMRLARDLEGRSLW